MGSKLYIYGYTDVYPYGDSVTLGYEGPNTLLKLKAGQIIPGLSSAPVLNMRTGSVCGVVIRTRGQQTDLGGRAVPAAVLAQLLEGVQ
jgi:hypothetical protein